MFVAVVGLAFFGWESHVKWQQRWWAQREKQCNKLNEVNNINNLLIYTLSTKLSFAISTLHMRLPQHSSPNDLSILSTFIFLLYLMVLFYVFFFTCFTTSYVTFSLLFLSMVERHIDLCIWGFFFLQFLLQKWYFLKRISPYDSGHLRIHKIIQTVGQSKKTFENGAKTLSLLTLVVRPE